MDYEKKYKEALDRARQFITKELYAECNGNLVEYIFPELKEVEDERIRKSLIKHFREYESCTFDGLTSTKVLAWLERQDKGTNWKPSKEEMDVLYGLAYITNQYDEHKEEVITRLYQDLKREFFNGSSYENMFPNTEDGVRRRSTIQVLEYARSLDTYNQYGKADIDKNIAWLEKQGDNNNEDADILQRFSFYSYKDEPDILYLAEIYVNESNRNQGIGTKILEVADEVAMSMGYHIIRLKTQKDTDADRLYRKNGYNFLTNEGNQVWLEKQGEQKTSVVDFKAKDWYVSKVDGKIYNAKFMEKTPTNQARKLEIEKAAMSATGIIKQEEWFIKGAEWSDKNPSYICSEKQNEQKPTDEEMKELLRTEYEKGRADTIAEMKSSWSEKDEKVIAIINNALTESNTPPDDYDKVYDWLESLRKRIGG